jgi:hypothetical protein
VSEQCSTSRSTCVDRRPATTSNSTFKCCSSRPPWPLSQRSSSSERTFPSSLLLFAMSSARHGQAKQIKRCFFSQNQTIVSNFTTARSFRSFGGARRGSSELLRHAPHADAAIGAGRADVVARRHQRLDLAAGMVQRIDRS